MVEHQSQHVERGSGCLELHELAPPKELERADALAPVRNHGNRHRANRLLRRSAPGTRRLLPGERMAVLLSPAWKGRSGVRPTRT